MSIKAIVSLTGAEYSTVHGYINCLLEALCRKVQRERAEGSLMLGGPGKIVEVDEMFVCQRKYGRGRRTAKEGTWVLGRAEVNEASHPIENPRFIEMLKQREDQREEAAMKRLEKENAEKHKKITKRRCQTAFEPSLDPVVVDRSEWFGELFGDERNEENEQEDGIDIVHVARDVEVAGNTLTRLELENQLKRLFSQSRKNQPKNTLFFVLPDRCKETLHRFIQENVKPGSTIYTDDWRGYIGLSSKGFVHRTICHEKRFSRFEVDGIVVSRITTNHIERTWVELRRTLKYMTKDTFIKYIDLETQRQRVMFIIKNDQNVVSMLKDFAKYGATVEEN